MPWYIYSVTELNGTQTLHVTNGIMPYFNVVKNIATGGLAGAKKHNKVELVIDLPDEWSRDNVERFFWKVVKIYEEYNT